MDSYLLLALPCFALLIWIFRPRAFQRPSSPALPGSELGFRSPPEDFSAFLWMAALPPRLEPESHSATPNARERAPAGARPHTETAPEASAPAPLDQASASVLAFWREAGPARWFAKDAGFDRRFRERFLALHEAAARGELNHWMHDAEGALALLLLLDQFPRNAFRGTSRMYATDGLALCLAERALELGHDRSFDAELRLFFYLPFGHSERLSDQERSVALNRGMAAPNPSHAQRHHDIVKRFGRFPHRNPILQRAMRPDEQAFLDEGGFAG